MQAAIDPVSGLPDRSVVANDFPVSAVSWPAIAAGTVVAAAASLALVTLGAGIGFAALSPWPRAGASATEFTMLMAIAYIVVQWLSAGIGGYVTGRLRSRWATLHTHEVFFRDTAHGLITWASATLLVSTVTAIIAGTAAGAAGHVASAAGMAAAAGTNAHVSSPPTVDPYDVDLLLRPASADMQPAASQGTAGDQRMQITRTLAAGLATGEIPAADRAYLSQVIQSQARISSNEADARVQDAAAKAKMAHDQALQAADAARKAAEAASIFSAFAMVVGAFIACVAAALGGHRRDVHA